MLDVLCQAVADGHKSNRAIQIDYTNWVGERSVRVVIPEGLEFSSNQWHPKLQWMMRAFDCDKKEWRSFALLGIHSVDFSNSK